MNNDDHVDDQNVTKWNSPVLENATQKSQYIGTMATNGDEVVHNTNPSYPAIGNDASDNTNDIMKMEGNLDLKNQRQIDESIPVILIENADGQKTNGNVAASLLNNKVDDGDSEHHLQNGETGTLGEEGMAEQENVAGKIGTIPVIVVENVNGGHQYSQLPNGGTVHSNGESLDSNKFASQKSMVESEIEEVENKRNVKEEIQPLLNGHVDSNGAESKDHPQVYIVNVNEENNGVTNEVPSPESDSGNATLDQANGGIPNENNIAEDDGDSQHTSTEYNSNHLVNAEGEITIEPPPYNGTVLSNHVSQLPEKQPIPNDNGKEEKDSLLIDEESQKPIVVENESKSLLYKISDSPPFYLILFFAIQVS